ncbi:uncharacterized protein N7459_008598 [Penicillium hispanicum]|uniref:uncharacterized protein n=1 Tax=Penicillium hispanicum TaxID=1080232 RepID=UPI00254003F4|nr:uncharacterized protein N7459_008598 [Penicillium hispanicum]KAJ5574171.1 hypothetical protein N7459_008598 [Penicillium hispanicum]
MTSRSPTAATPLPKSSAAPESPLKDAPVSPQTAPFPPPQTFEIIPPLHGILLRLLSRKSSSDATRGPPGEIAGAPGASTDAPSQGQQGPPNIPGNGTSDTTASQSPLDVKNIPTETSSVKIRIQKARAMVEGLPDVHRSIHEQQKEIDELEDRVARLRSVISDFGNRAAMK